MKLKVNLIRLKSFFTVLVLLLCSCQSTSSSVNPSGNQITSVAIDPSQCPNKPSGSLSNPPLIDLEGKTVQRTGTIRSSENLGFMFQGKQGKTLSYRYNDEICVWIYSPDNSLLSGVELPIDGPYTVHFNSLKGTTTFEIEMSFAASNPPASSQFASNPPGFVTQSPQNNSSQKNDLTQDQAVSLVNSWLNSKGRVFAHPFDYDPLHQYVYTSGSLYRDITKPEGSIDWLQKNNSYYRYHDSKITDVFSFSVSGSKPELIVRIYENLTLYTPTGIDRSSSGPATITFVYSFIKENGQWKIFDYRKHN